MTRTVVRILDGELVLAAATADGPEGPVTAGACALTEQDALTRAASEATERTRLLDEGPHRVVSTAQARAARGAMHEVVAAPIVPQEWVRTEPIRPGDPVWVPADLVLLRWHGSRELPVQQTSVGSAAHPDRAQAVDSGARECVERYAVRRIWSATTGLIPVTEHLDAAVPASLLAALRRHGLTAHAWLVDATLPAVVAVVMVASAQGRVTFGASCARTLPDGLRHALCEAVSVRAAFAGPDGIKRNRVLPDEWVDYALRAASFQDAFLAFLRRLECAAPPAAGLAAGGAALPETDILAYLEDELQVTPTVFDLGRRAELHVVKVVVPAPEFFVSRRHRGYVLAPGYLE
jgi:ribosomal protein S12 methylthiotransferase accessory factor YcaO